jgi:flagellar basal-body rod modification protein FlgD
MADLIQAIGSDGKVEASTANKKASNMGTSNLGKDEFLQLLVTQMQNQNPLEPKSDTEWIAQLANFSSLEEMQNMRSTMTGMQGMEMIGKYVDVTTKDPSGDIQNVSGIVQYVNVSGTETKVCIDGKLFDANDVVNVYESKEEAEGKSVETV